MVNNKASKQSKRYRISVPPKDVSVIAWMDEQFNLSESIRLLIKENIECNGLVDIACEPVKQLPKRGRPPVANDTSKVVTEPPEQDIEVVSETAEPEELTPSTANPSKADDIFSAMRIGR